MDASNSWSTTGRSETRLIERITEGMTVVDVAGEKVGKVEYVQLGDPEAITTAGNEPRGGDPGLLGALGRAIGGGEGEPDVPEPARSQLLRTGFIKVDGAGLTDTDRYVRPDLIANVAEDTATVTVRKEQLPWQS